jgi:hypothetical protein
MSVFLWRNAADAAKDPVKAALVLKAAFKHNVHDLFI